MDEKTSEVLFKIADKIEAALNEYPVAAPNAVIPRRIRFLAAQLSSRDQYAAEKAYKIVELADMFYSDRKHTKHPGGSDGLWATMTFDLLGRIRSQARNRESGGD